MDMERVQRTLDEGDAMLSRQKDERHDIELAVQVDRFQADIKKKELRRGYDSFIALQRDELDKAVQSQQSEFAKKLRTDQVALLNKAITDQRAMYAKKLQQERALHDASLQKVREDNDSNIKSEREYSKSMLEHASTQLAELENERIKLKSLIQSLTGRDEQVHNGMITMPKAFFDIAVDNYCAPDLIMKFKVHKLKELYPDLQKYDLRAHLREFRIRRVPEATTIDFGTFTEALSWHGYIGDAEVYYLNPDPESEPLTGLVKIVGAEEFKEMVRAHAAVGTKICHLYLVSTYADCHPDDERAMDPWAYDEQDEDEEAP